MPRMSNSCDVSFEQAGPIAPACGLVAIPSQEVPDEIISPDRGPSRDQMGSGSFVSKTTAAATHRIMSVAVATPSSYRPGWHTNRGVSAAPKL
jgi:hypothetical protein